MAERIHKQKSEHSGETSTGTTNDMGSSVESSAASKLKAEIDDLLDEIDEVLEANAEDFVKSYVQKGGE
jgi:ubiquitin-like protein Pup